MIIKVTKECFEKAIVSSVDDNICLVCPVSQALRLAGIVEPRVGYTTFSIDKGSFHLPKEFESITKLTRDDWKDCIREVEGEITDEAK